MDVNTIWWLTWMYAIGAVVVYVAYITFMSRTLHNAPTMAITMVGLIGALLWPLVLVVTAIAWLIHSALVSTGIWRR